MTRRFPRTARVRTRAEYDRIFQHGRRVALPVLALHWRPAPPAGDSVTSPAPAADPAADPVSVEPASSAATNGAKPGTATPNAAHAAPPVAAADGTPHSPAPARRTAKSPARAQTAAVIEPLHGDGARLGLAVSRKVDRRAVVRNRIKRRLREAFRERRMQLAPGEYVVVARPGAAALDADALQRALLTLLRRAGALPVVPPAGTMPAAACTDRVQPPSR